MQEGKRYLASECDQEGLVIEERADSKACRGVIGDSADDAEAEKVFYRRGAVLEEVIRGGAERAVGYSGYERPDAPAARDGIEERDAEKAEEETPYRAEPLGKGHEGREQGLDVRRAERDEAEEEHEAPADNELKPSCSEGKIHIRSLY